MLDSPENRLFDYAVQLAYVVVGGNGNLIESVLRWLEKPNNVGTVGD